MSDRILLEAVKGGVKTNKHHEQHLRILPGDTVATELEVRVSPGEKKSRRDVLRKRGCSDVRRGGVETLCWLELRQVPLQNLVSCWTQGKKQGSQVQVGGQLMSELFPMAAPAWRPAWLALAFFSACLAAMPFSPGSHYKGPQPHGLPYSALQSPPPPRMSTLESPLSTAALEVPEDEVPVVDPIKKQRRALFAQVRYQRSPHGRAVVLVLEPLEPRHNFRRCCCRKRTRTPGVRGLPTMRAARAPLVGSLAVRGRTLSRSWWLGSSTSSRCHPTRCGSP